MGPEHLKKSCPLVTKETALGEDSGPTMSPMVIKLFRYRPLLYTTFRVRLHLTHTGFSRLLVCRCLHKHLHRFPRPRRRSLTSATATITTCHPCHTTVTFLPADWVSPRLGCTSERKSECEVHAGGGLQEVKLKKKTLSIT